MRSKQIVFILFYILIYNSLINAQLTKILVLNEGAFDYTKNTIIEPVSIGSFDINSRIYTKLNEVAGARFASDIIQDGSSYWVAADKEIVVYDLLSHQKLRSFTLEGVRKLACYKDFLIVTRGEYLKQLSAYIQIYNKHTFDLIYEVPYQVLPYTAENIIVKDDNAFIAINNGFDFGKEVGKIVKLNLTTLKLEAILELGPEGKNPENLMLVKDQLISLNNKDFTGSSISLIDLNSNQIDNYNLTNVSSLCGTSTLVGESVLYQEIGKEDLGLFQLNTKQSAFYKNIGKSFYGMSYDSKSNLICAAETDFKSFGRVNVYDSNLDEKYVFTAGVSPGYFVFVNASSVSTKQLESLQFELSPNPIVSKFKIITKDPIDEIKVMDFYGKVLIHKKQKSIDLEGLQAGAYILSVQNKDQIGYKRFVKIQK
ncbi:MAG: T9SS type A sorting domain-containing protein [Saprospiraceae bacterium]